MGKNQSLLKAKANKNDEFYTQYEDIEQELRHYASFFLGKRIYLPCDNPYQSQFFTYFVRHFHRLDLKELTATCYDASIGQLSLFDDYDDTQELIVKPKKAYKAVIREVAGEENLEALASLPANQLSILQGNGDFASQECVDLMKQADVIVTNPPFSLFRQLLHFLVTLDKDYVLLGASQTVTYSEAFQLFMNGRLHLGFTPFSNSLDFEVPAGNDYERVKNGKFYKSVPIAWYTNFEIRPPIPKLRLTQAFDSQLYSRLDDRNEVINVDTVSSIPMDYRKPMAVPITFLKVWDKRQFQILGKIDKAMVGGKEKFTRLLIQHL